MTAIAALGAQVGKEALNQAGNATNSIVGMGVNALDEALFGNRRRRKQVEQQQKFTDMQQKSNFATMDKQHQQQLEMFEATGYGAQKRQMIEAGLNPAMMYGQAGQGVTGTTGGSAGMGIAEGASAEKNSSYAMDIAGQGLMRRMQEAQIKNLESVTEKNEAEADLTKEKKTTESEQRDVLIENIKQQGLGKWLENIQQKAKIATPIEEGEIHGSRNEVYGEDVWMQAGSYIQQELTNAVLKTEAEIGNTNAQALLTNKKAEGYYRELLNEIIKAEAQGKSAENGAVIAQAIKLTSEWDTGEFTNWKTWVNLGVESVKTLGSVIGKVTTKGAIK